MASTVRRPRPASIPRCLSSRSVHLRPGSSTTRARSRTRAGRSTRSGLRNFSPLPKASPQCGVVERPPMNTLLLAGMLLRAGCPQPVTDAVKKAHPEAKIASCKEEKEHGKTQYEVKLDKLELDVSPEGQ